MEDICPPFSIIKEIIMTTDTIAAVATALSNSGIGIIRVSGNDAVPIVNTLFKNKKRQPLLEKMNSHTIQYGFIVNDQDEIVDEVMVSLMKAPRSFTTEDTVEINCHGGVLMINKFLGFCFHMVQDWQSPENSANVLS